MENNILKMTNIVGRKSMKKKEKNIESGTFQNYVGLLLLLADVYQSNGY